MEGEEEAKATSHSEEQITNGDEDEVGEEEEEGETENEDQPELPSGLTGMVLLSALSSVSGCYTMWLFFFASMCCPFTASLVKWVSAEADRNSCTASVFRRRYVSSSNSSTRTWYWLILQFYCLTFMWTIWLCGVLLQVNYCCFFKLCFQVRLRTQHSPLWLI